MMNGDRLLAHVNEVALHDLRLLMRMTTAAAMPPGISEPIVCRLMKWEWVEGHSAHDALAKQARLQIKYSKVGYVSCPPAHIRRWDYLAWVHAPYRLPRLILLIPSQVLKGANFSKNTFHIMSNISYLRGASGIKAWSFDVNTMKDLEGHVKSPKPRALTARQAIDQLADELREAKGAVQPRKARQATVAPVPHSAGRRTGVGRGNLSALNGQRFEGEFRGKTHKGVVNGGTMTIRGVAGFQFHSLSAAARYLTQYQVNGKNFWRQV